MTVRGQAKLESNLLARKGFASPAAPHETPPLLRWPVATGSEGEAQKKGRSSPGSGSTGGHGRLKFTLRLDPQRHLRLRLAAAHTGRSMQMIALEALDAYVTDLSHEVRAGACLCLNTDMLNTDTGGTAPPNGTVED